MKRDEPIKEVLEDQFKRLTDVKRNTLSHMIKAVMKTHQGKHKKRTRRNNLSMEEMILMLSRTSQ